MKDELQKALSEMTDANFRELELNLSISNNLRTLKNQFGVKNSEIMELMQWNDYDLKAALNAAYPFTLREVSVIQTLLDKKLSQKIIRENQILNVAK